MAVVGVSDPFLVDSRTAIIHRRPILSAKEVGRVLGEEIIVVLADDCGFLGAKKALEGWVAGEIGSRGVLEPDEVGDGL